MKKRQKNAHDAAAVSNAVGTLLRLANADLKDARLLSSGRSPANAPALVHLAFDRLSLAVIATECGWPLPSAATDRSVIPDANPLKAVLTRTAKLQPALQSCPAVAQDGNAAPAPDRDVIRAAILATSAVLKDLAAHFEVDLLGEAPARRASPVRPDPVIAAPPPAPPAKAALPARRKAASEPVSPPTKPLTAPSPPDPEKIKPPARVVNAPDPTPPPAQQTEPHAVAGRSPIEMSSASGSITSTVFWALMESWRIEDMPALALIGHPGGLTKKGTRPRFKLLGDEVTMLRGLQEIASALTSLQLEPRAWVEQPIEAAPFGGATPIAYLTEHKSAGVRDTIRFILQQGLRLSVSADTRAPRSSGASA